MSKSVSYIPDAVFPGDKFDIPMLDMRMQAEYIEAPVKMWGQNTRRQQFTGTFGFYINDYKFTALWKHPESLLNTGCSVAIEPNFSTSSVMPEWQAINGIGKKRWIARFWQTHGVKIIVDLNVAERFSDMNLFGVPDGWSAFATRAQRGSNHLIPLMHEKACQKAGDVPKLFLVYGGGADVRNLCQENAWLHVPEHMAQWQRKNRNVKKNNNCRGVKHG
jgi:hypothetical protein